MTEKRRIGIREINFLKESSTVWDRDVPGFGARRQKSEAVSYVVIYRTAENRQRFHTIGRHGAPWTPDTARKEARRILGSVATGADPAAAKKQRRHAESITALCDLYLADAEAGRLLTKRKTPKQSSTIITDRSRIERHVKPLLGQRAVASVTSSDIEFFMHSVAEGKTAVRAQTGKSRGLAIVRGGKGAASRTVGLLGAIFSYAVRHRMRSDNPVRGVERFADGRRLRRLSDGEYTAVGNAIQMAASGGTWPPALGAATFLILTGWRTGEVIGLTWQEIDLARRTATLGSTKTGLSMRPLSRAACDLLQKLDKRSGLVFEAARGNGPMTGFPKFWARIVMLGGLSQDITPHVLRHSFASLANDLGYSEPTIAALIGHKGRSVTSRYVHSADAVLLAAADVVANKTCELMGLTRNPDIVRFKQIA
ncbi:site-specific integrase [Bradyrhizobium diazoefficiens]|nr:site-specific integrase [Bradyrhizobium diazoefficiens]QQO19085.1 site-specific integrase [Bradyrhizobium diazoefficiens]